MKIAVLTLPLHTNYGGILQAYALQRVLTDMGHEAVLARFADGALYRLYHPFVVWLKQKGLMSYRHNYPLTKREKRVIADNTDLFVAEHIRMTLPVTGRRLSRMGFDAFIVGSDQVWRNYDTRYFLGFLPEDHPARQIAYAASFGTDRWPFMPDQTEELGRLAARFDAVSVREDSGVELYRSHFGIEPPIMPDPTLLLDREHYAELAGKAVANGEPSVMSYILDRNNVKSRMVGSVCQTLSLPENNVTPHSAPGHRVPVKECVWPSVERWLAGFANAEFVVTDSFHGTVFALLFNKPFAAICNNERGAARFHSLLRIFGLEERLVDTETGITPELMRRKIDFGKVNGIIEDRRHKACAFLAEALGDVKK